MVETDGGASGRVRRSAGTHDPRQVRLLARHRVPYRSRHALLLSVGRGNRAVPDLHPSHPIFYNYNGSHHLWLVDPRFTCPTRCDTEAVRRGDSPGAGDAAGKLHHSQTPDNRLPVRRAAGPGFRLRWDTDARLWLTSALSPMKSCCTWRICPIPPSRVELDSKPYKGLAPVEGADQGPDGTAVRRVRSSHFGKQGWNVAWDCGYPPYARTKGSP